MSFAGTPTFGKSGDPKRKFMMTSEAKHGTDASTGIMICDDLIFFSRVASTARAAGLQVRQARSAEAAIEIARQSPPGGVIVDLHNDGLDLPLLLASLREVCAIMPQVTGFGSHVAADLLRSAREAGCDRVLPRSQFVKLVETNLKDWLTPSRPTLQSRDC